MIKLYLYKLIFILYFISLTNSLKIGGISINSPIINKIDNLTEYNLYSANKQISFCNYTFIPKIKDETQLVFTQSDKCNCEEKIYNAYINKYTTLIIITDTDIPGLYSLYCNTEYNIDVFEVSKKDIHELILPKKIYYDKNTLNEFKEIYYSDYYFFIIVFEIILGSTEMIGIIIYYFKGLRKGGTSTYYSGSKKFRYLFYISSILSMILLTLVPIFNIKIYKSNIVTENLIKNLSLSASVFSTILLIVSWVKRYILNYNMHYLKNILKTLIFFTSIYTIFIIVLLTSVFVHFIYYIDIPHINYLMFVLISLISIIMSISFIYIIYDTKKNRKSSILAILYFLLSLYIGSLLFTGSYILTKIILNEISFLIILSINFFNSYLIEPHNFGILYDHVG